MRTELLSIAIVLLSGCAQRSAPVPPLPAAPTVTVPGLREPERMRSYTLGAYVDPADPAVRHESHLIHRLERTSRWNLGAVEDSTAVAGEREILPKMPPPMAVETPLPEPRAPVVREAALEPDGTGMIDLTGRDGSAEPNPFAARTEKAAKEVSLIVSGVIGGLRPAAIINGHTLEVGGNIDGLRLRAVESDAVLFEYGRWRLRVPVSAVGTRVRMTN